MWIKNELKNRKWFGMPIVPSNVAFAPVPSAEMTASDGQATLAMLQFNEGKIVPSLRKCCMYKLYHLSTFLWPVFFCFYAVIYYPSASLAAITTFCVLLYQQGNETGEQMKAFFSKDGPVQFVGKNVTPMSRVPCYLWEKFFALFKYFKLQEWKASCCKKQPSLTNVFQSSVMKVTSDQ